MEIPLEGKITSAIQNIMTLIRKPNQPDSYYLSKLSFGNVPVTNGEIAKRGKLAQLYQ